MSSKRSLYLKHVARTDPDGATLEVDMAEGVFVIDKDGKRYFDLASGIGPSILGHQHPVVLEAINQQSQRYLHTMVYGMHIQSPMVLLAEKLLNLLPGHLEQVYFLSAGTEAVEAALKIAKLYTGKSDIVAATDAYHGSTMAAESLRSDLDFTRALAPLMPGVRHIRFNELASLDAIDSQTACVILETVQAEAGIVVPNLDFLIQLRSKCNEVGALLIFDEIQMAMGRTGRLFAFEHFGVYPDILVLGKAIGGGLPLSCVIAGKDIMKSISHKHPLSHLTTFGGHPLCCATGLATLDLIVKKQLWKRAEEIGQLYENLLANGRWKFKRFGAMFGLECETADEAVDLKNNLQKHGVISDLLLFKLNMVRMAPPLIITDEEIEMSCRKILSVVG